MSPEDGTDLTNSLVSSEESPDAASIRHDEANLVRRAVQELPHDLRTAVLLFEFEGLSHVEIAAVLKCSTKAVETRLYRARKALKVTLQKILREKSEE